MDKEEIGKEYFRVYEERIALEKEMTTMINNWVNGDESLNVYIVEKLLESGNRRLEELKELEKELYPLLRDNNTIKR